MVTTPKPKPKPKVKPKGGLLRISVEPEACGEYVDWEVSES